MLRRYNPERELRKVQNKGIYNPKLKPLIIISIFLMLLQIVSSFYFQVAVSSLTSSLDLKLIKFIVIFFLGICLFKIISNFIRNYYLNFISKNLDVHLFSDFLSHVFHLPLKFMENRTTGEVISRVEELTQEKNNR